MSLKDIIEGAKEEAQGNTLSMPTKKSEDGAADSVDAEKRSGFVKRSAANAKPAREAASSVRIENKPRAVDPLKNETKEEKKARRNRERDEEDLRTRALDLMQKDLPGYKKTDHIFWVLLMVGMVLAVITLIFSWGLGGQDNPGTVANVISIVLLVASYAIIIIAMVYDFRKRRPYRRQAEDRVRSMSTKKVAEYVEQKRMEEAAAKAAKKK